ncbi:hypothetical protein [Azospirillum sp. SYSU D00513]|uniref:hypothetical protein n=1 Tax=Azospirillum sp. SYSU D00513 TaxID=2812561 RepID=UPI001A9631C8|nr:hypothetical protein [Azospirillum sp. SYSU D00513]
MLTALILVCSTAITPELRDCNRDNAVSVMRLPEETMAPGSCLKLGSAYLAQTEIGTHLASDERVKVVCTRSRAPNRLAQAQFGAGFR